MSNLVAVLQTYEQRYGPKYWVRWAPNISTEIRTIIRTENRRKVGSSRNAFQVTKSHRKRTESIGYLRLSASDR